jgi:serine/threonine protein kinase
MTSSRTVLRSSVHMLARFHGMDPAPLWKTVRDFEPSGRPRWNRSNLAISSSGSTRELRLPLHPEGRFDPATLLDWQRRFLAQASGVIGVIELEDARVVEDLPVVVVEMPGTSLTEHVRDQGLLSEAESLALAHHLGSTISELHRRGLHHLDIRPGTLVRGRRGWVLDHPRPLPIEESRYSPEHDLPAFRDVWGCASILSFAATGDAVIEAESMSDEVRRLIEAMPLGDELAGFRELLLVRVADWLARRSA